MTEKRIYLVQHPETELNTRRIVQGHLDSPLTARGQNDALRYGRELIDKKLCALYSSDLGRCVQTTAIIRSQIGDVPLYFSQKLREQNFGRLNGWTDEDVVRVLDLDNPNSIPPDGESFTQMTERVLRYLDELVDLGISLLIVTHDGPRRAIEHSRFSREVEIIK